MQSILIHTARKIIVEIMVSYTSCMFLLHIYPSMLPINNCFLILRDIFIPGLVFLPKISKNLMRHSLSHQSLKLFFLSDCRDKFTNCSFFAVSFFLTEIWLFRILVFLTVYSYSIFQTIFAMFLR